MKKDKDTSENRRKFISWKYFVFIVVIIIGLTSFFIFKDKNLKPLTVDYKEIVAGFETEALVIRNEKTYKAPLSGELTILLNEGERAPYGEKIAYIENGEIKYNIYTEQPGIISYAYDGLEERLKFGKITPQVLSEYDQFERDYHQYVSGNKVQKGDKLYRNINNYEQYLLIEVDKERAEKFNQNEVVFVDHNQNNKDGKLIKSKIKKIYKHNNKYFLLVLLDKYLEMWNNTRWVNIKLIKNIYRGLAVPSSAVFKTTAGSQVLLYTFDHEVVLKDVEIVESTEDWTIVENLEIGDQVITNPQNANYGRNDN
ncbi:MAG TPA: HlyD family efflux transporter periplasmic adaptor subunit [Halanaerobiales bacterium]|nr:HlyD family efflux transporter periplasmic adaptor subunit [Halanaerobiales bacterium]